jgi:hypothetical protein
MREEIVMNKFLVKGAALVFFFLGSSAMADSITTEVLLKASQVATETFKSEYGAAMHDAISAIEVTKGSDSISVVLTYGQTNAPQSIEYFCHFHDANELDCHEH